MKYIRKVMKALSDPNRVKNCKITPTKDGVRSRASDHFKDYPAECFKTFENT